jgi:hypothetical protein
LPDPEREKWGTPDEVFCIDVVSTPKKCKATEDSVGENEEECGLPGEDSDTQTHSRNGKTIASNRYQSPYEAGCSDELCEISTQRVHEPEIGSGE